MDEIDELALRDEDNDIPAGAVPFVRASIVKEVHELSQYLDGVFTYRPTTGRSRAPNAEPGLPASDGATRVEVRNSSGPLPARHLDVA